MTAAHGGRRVLLLVNADCTDRERHSPRGPRGPRRRSDFDAIAEALGADVLDWSAVRSSTLGSLIERAAGWYVAAAALALLRHRRYRLIWCMSEKEGAMLALAFKIVRARTPLMMVAVVPTSRAMWAMVRVLRVQSHITCMYPTSSLARDTLVSQWKLPAEKVVLLPYQVDVDFFDPRWADGSPSEVPLVVAVGRESRDYETLLAAVRDLPIRLTIAPGSHWAPEREEAWRAALAPNVTVVTCDYVALRDLYASSAFVVVPLHETTVQNGTTAVQEAMAMGRAVVVTRTTGQRDLIADDPGDAHEGPGPLADGVFARLFAPSDKYLRGPTGIYVPPHDVVALRAAIERLLRDPGLASELGARGRAVCCAVVSLDRHVERILEAARPYLGDAP